MIYLYSNKAAASDEILLWMLSSLNRNGFYVFGINILTIKELWNIYILVAQPKKSGENKSYLHLKIILIWHISKIIIRLLRNNRVEEFIQKK